MCPFSKISKQSLHPTVYAVSAHWGQERFHLGTRPGDYSPALGKLFLDQVKNNCPSWGHPKRIILNFFFCLLLYNICNEKYKFLSNSL